MKIIDPAAFKKFEAQFKFNPRGEDKKIAFTDISSILTAMDQAAGQLVEGASGNTGKFGAQEPKQPVEKFSVDTQAAIGSIQNIFGKPGVSIAICGEDHTYKHPPQEPQPPQPHNLLQAAQNEVDQWNLKNVNQQFTLKGYFKGDNPSYWRDDLKPKIKQLGTDQENYVKALQAFPALQQQYASSVKDYTRAQAMIKLADGGETIAPDLVILERGMIYNPGNSRKFVKEEELIETGFSIKQRSAVVAAYLFLCAGGGKIGENFRVLIFFGEEHKDIFDWFEGLAQMSVSLPWVKGSKRNYGLVPSHVGK